MKSTSETQTVGVRLPPELLGMVDQVARHKACDRSEALRHIIQVGAAFLLRSRNINVDRLLTGLEILVIDCLRKASENDPKDAEKLVDAASTNVETYHA